jgi:hypothetical protein
MQYPENDSPKNANAPIEGIVLDSEGQVIHDPRRPEDVRFGQDGSHRSHPKFKMAWSGPRAMGLVPKLLMGGAFIVLLVFGLTIAAVALGILLVGSIVRLFLTPKRR